MFNLFVKAFTFMAVLFVPYYSQAHIEAESKIHERVVWGAPISPYVRVVLVTLNEKKLPYTHKKVLPSVLTKALDQEIDSKFAQISPFGKIPVYEEVSQEGTNFTLLESAVISDYINDIEKGPSLRPTCSKANARVSYFMAYAGNTLAPATHGFLFEHVVKPGILKQAVDEERINKILGEELPMIFDYLEKSLSDGRAWIAGTKDVSLADIMLVSHLVTLDTAQLPGVSTAIGSRRPHLLSYYKKVVARDSFQKALSEVLTDKN